MRDLPPRHLRVSQKKKVLKIVLIENFSNAFIILLQQSCETITFLSDSPCWQKKSSWRKSFLLSLIYSYISEERERKRKPLASRSKRGKVVLVVFLMLGKLPYIDKIVWKKRYKPRLMRKGVVILVFFLFCVVGDKYWCGLLQQKGGNKRDDFLPLTTTEKNNIYFTWRNNLVVKKGCTTLSHIKKKQLKIL